MRAHVAGCPECTRYTEQVQRFEDRLDRALRVDMLPGVRAAGWRGLRTRLGRSRRVRRRWLAAAASLLLACVVSGTLWLAAPGSSLAADVVSHMAEEPQAWARTEVPVPPSQLEAVLGESHMRLKANAGLVTYASSCLFRGHQVPHLVVQTAAGPVTVMVLTHEATQGQQRFHEHGYEGVIEAVPGHGSLAVLERGPAFDKHMINEVAAQVENAIDWTG
jgi:ferric-dicitrate binding protein FerR (iron transport regulator)